MSGYPPGVWVDKNGALHFSLPEILEAEGIPVTPENLEIAARLFDEGAREMAPQAKVIRTGTCPACGITGMEPHEAGCWWIAGGRRP